VLGTVESVSAPFMVRTAVEGTCATAVAVQVSAVLTRAAMVACDRMKYPLQWFTRIIHDRSHRRQRPSLYKAGGGPRAQTSVPLVNSSESYLAQRHGSFYAPPHSTARTKSGTISPVYWGTDFEPLTPPYTPPLG
jgi:hypothetical protein